MAVEVAVEVVVEVEEEMEEEDVDFVQSIPQLFSIGTGLTFRLPNVAYFSVFTLFRAHFQPPFSSALSLPPSLCSWARRRLLTTGRCPAARFRFRCRPKVQEFRFRFPR